MKQRELLHIIVAIIILTIVIEFSELITANFTNISKSLLFAFLIISINILGKKVAARNLDADVTHEIWTWSRYGFKKHSHLKKPVATGLIIPLIFSIFSLGVLKIMTLLNYETTALKRRAAKRHGYYSYTEMTEWHNALIGGAGIFAVLALAFISYFIPGLEGLPTLATLYAVFNLIPISKLDGTHILFGSRPLYMTLIIITLIFLGYALFLV